ncbi:DotA/TraY family protein [Serratia nevei]|uniref:DotA/TraY family protein n=1 Tax=Serratia nevei TaxID=2703794 RepID=UPI00254C9F30|nr:DotA/TraY family protein [Serratia nevei]MDK5165568.1 DotA/TraY family protein [Serratia nevei]
MMKKMKKGALLTGLMLILLACVSDAAMAADIFAMPAGDMTIQTMMNPVFGDSASSKISGLFGTFNAAVLFLGGILTAYGIFSGVAQTAHDGEMLGRRFSSLWVPIRVSIGIAAIVPINGGYCPAQMIVNYVATQGINAGAGMWNSYVQHDDTFVASNYTIPDVPAVRELALSMFKTFTCAAAMQKEADRLDDESAQAMNQEKTSIIIPTVSTGTVVYGTKEDPNACGGYTVPDYSTDETGIGAAQQAALSVLEMKMKSLANSIADTSTNIADMNTAFAQPFEAAVAEYQTTVKNAANAAIAKASSKQRETSQKSAAGGWMMAGAYYASQGATLNEVSAATNLVPSGVAPTMGDVGGYQARAVEAAINPNGANQSMWDKIKGAGSAIWEKAKTTANAAMDMVLDPKILDNAVNEKFGPLMQSLKNVANGTGNPIVNMQNVGFAALTAAGAGFIASMVVGVFSTTGGLVIAGLSTALIGFGATNAYYLPIVPAATYYGAVLGWYALYIECLIAAPIWALMHIRFDGEGMVGSASSGYKIILNMFLRPPLITLGFGIAMSSMEFLINGWNKTFTAAFLANFSITGIGGFINCLAMFCIYTITMLAFVHKILSLTTIIPEAITKWIDGGHDSLGTNMANGAGEHARHGVSGMFGVVQSQAGRLNQGSQSGKGNGPGRDKKDDNQKMPERDGKNGEDVVSSEGMPVSSEDRTFGQIFRDVKGKFGKNGGDDPPNVPPKPPTPPGDGGGDDDGPPPPPSGGVPGGRASSLAESGGTSGGAAASVEGGASGGAAAGAEVGTSGGAAAGAEGGAALGPVGAVAGAALSVGMKVAETTGKVVETGAQVTSQVAQSASNEASKSSEGDIEGNSDGAGKSE